MSSKLTDQSALLERLFQDLSGTWLLSRNLQSTNSSEPSRRCSGTATFTSTPSPLPVLDADGKLDKADAEMVYHEHGELELMEASGSNFTSVRTFTFTRKYIWRLQKTDTAHCFSVWFTKPGTDTIDYLFHKVDIFVDQGEISGFRNELVLRGTGGHLCVEDFYSSSYAFTLTRSDEDSLFKPSSWTTIHKVLGPEKDQHIETTFIRA